MVDKKRVRTITLPSEEYTRLVGRNLALEKQVKSFLKEKKTLEARLEADAGERKGLQLLVKSAERELGETNKRLRQAFADGVRAAASFAGSWDAQIAGTVYMFEDIVLGKFNLVSKNKMRRKF